jgi:DNA (cytosine-5)-methyltransferase 1
MTEQPTSSAKRNCDGQPSLAPATGYAAPLRLLDLFCCEGGAGTGYARAGFDVTGVDIEHKDKNPHPLIVADAIEYAREHAHEYDAIHASPPCQSYSKAMKHLATPQPMLIDAVREILTASGKPWVIENVVGAPLANDTDLFGRHGVELCGTMFGLRIYRHRIFETNFQLPLPPAPCDHSRHAMNPHRSEGRERIYAEHGRQDPEKLWAKEMGVEWMSRHGAREAVPPCFTEWIGRELLRVAARHNDEVSHGSAEKKL